MLGVGWKDWHVLQASLFLTDCGYLHWWSRFILKLKSRCLFIYHSLDKINLWGEGFREGYTRLGLLKPFLAAGAATYFFTATATEEDKKVAISQYKLSFTLGPVSLLIPISKFSSFISTSPKKGLVLCEFLPYQFCKILQIANCKKILLSLWSVNRPPTASSSHAELEHHQ